MSQSTLISPPSPTVALYNDRPATTSREVAKFFGKRHDNIVRDIRNLIANTPETFHALNFEEMSEDVEIGNGAIRQDTVFLLFRDGFMLLVMGYTGKKAMQIKIAYIEAFNALEAELTQKTHRGRKALPKAEQQALPAADPFDTLLDNIEAVRLRTDEDVLKLFREAVRLADRRLLGADIWNEFWSPLYDWIKKAIVAPSSTKDPHFYATGTPIGLLKAVSQRLERQEVR